MMKLRILICEKYISDYRKALNKTDFKDIEISRYPCYCSNCEVFIPATKNESNEYHDVYIIPDTCIYYKKIKETGHDIYVLDYCFEHLIDLTTYNSFIKSGSYIVTEDWILNWENEIEKLGFTHDSIKDFFNSWCKKVVLIGFKPDDIVFENLKLFTTLIDLPSDFYEVSIKNIINIIKIIYYQYKLDFSEKLFREEKSRFQKRVAESEAVRDLISQIINENCFNTLLLKLNIIWKLLFGASDSIFDIVDTLINPTKVLEETESYQYDKNTNTLYCKLIANQILIGTLKVKGIRFPERLDRYDSLIKSVINISSIAILNLLEKSEQEKSATLLKTSYDSIEYGIFSTDLDDKIIMINSNCFEMLKDNGIELKLGSSIQEIKDNSFSIIKSIFENLKNNKDDIKKTIKIEKEIKQESRNYEISGFPILDNMQNFSGVVFTIRDITNEVLWMTDQVRFERLEGLNSVARGIAHEFNNKLTSVNGYLSLAKKSALHESKLLKYLEKSEKSIEKTMELTSRLLTFSDGGLPIKKKTNLVKLCESIVSEFEDKYQNKIIISSGENIPLLLIDSKQIKNAIFQIVDNSIKAIDENHFKSNAKISINIYDNFNYKKVVISITDNGNGISHNEITKVFDPLYTGNYSGTGLGLTIAQNILKKHNGTIQIESEIGIGTKVDISIPYSFD